MLLRPHHYDVRRKMMHLADVFLASKLIENRPRAFTLYVCKRLVHVRKHFLGHIELLALRNATISEKEIVLN